VTKRLLTPLLAAAVVFLAACGDSSEPAATVDGTEISQQQVVDELEAIRGNTDYLAAIEATPTPEGPQTPVTGEGEDAFNSAFVAQQLANQIQYTLVTNEVDRRGLDADDECRAAARASVVQRLAQASPSGDGEDVLAAFPESYQGYLVDREADVLLLQGDLIEQPCVADDAVGAYYDAHPEEFEQACSSHILVETEAEAQEIAGQLAGGADFAALAQERSTDTGSAAQGGSIGCVGRGELVPEYETALFGQPVGVVGAPVQSQFGFHVIRVDSRELPPLEEVRDSVAAVIAQDAQEAFGTWFRGAVADADVSVDPRYGTWDPSTAGIARPSFETTTTATTTAP
jgi:parvulin-like peptidyl-prolyl isomerase